MLLTRKSTWMVKSVAIFAKPAKIPPLSPTSYFVVMRKGNNE